jgi:Zn-dependent protease with chaperone function
MKTSSFSKALRSARIRVCLFLLIFLSFALTLATIWILTLALFEAIFGNCGENWKELFFNFENPKGLRFCALAFGVLWFAYATCFKFFDLKRLGADGLAEELGGRPLSKENAVERRFLEIVEEMARKFAVPVPSVYVLRDEGGINACVVGGDLNASAIVATAGAIRFLNRDELRAVVAHEFGHLINGDVKLNMGLIWTLASLRAPTVVGLEWFQQTGNSERGKNNGEGLGFLVFMLLFFVFGLPGFLGTKLVRAGMLRSQEKLADRFAAKHTRDPLALADALKKMGGAAHGTVVTAPRAVETAHLFFGSIWADGSGRMFRTYPALNARILELDPNFDGKFPTDVEEEAEARELRERAAAEPRPFGLDLNRLAEKLVALIGERTPLELTGVEATFGEIPEGIGAYLGDFDGARTVIFAILLDRKDWETRRRQLEMIRRSEANVANDAATTLLTERVEEAARALADAKFTTRAALVRLTVPALKSGTRKEYERFRSTTEALCNADGQIDLLEFALKHSAIRELDVWFELKPIPTARFGGFGNVNLSTPTALSYLAFCGANGDEEEARRAFAVGAGVLAELEDAAQGLEYQPFEDITLKDFKDAIERASHTTPRVKKNLLAAFFACVAADGQITEEEAELFDAISLALGAPAPIWQSVVDWAQTQGEAS